MLKSVEDRRLKQQPSLKPHSGQLDFEVPSSQSSLQKENTLSLQPIQKNVIKNNNASTFNLTTFQLINNPYNQKIDLGRVEQHQKYESYDFDCQERAFQEIHSNEIQRHSKRFLKPQGEFSHFIDSTNSFLKMLGKCKRKPDNGKPDFNNTKSIMMSNQSEFNSQKAQKIKKKYTITFHSSEKLKVVRSALLPGHKNIIRRDRTGLKDSIHRFNTTRYAQKFPCMSSHTKYETQIVEMLTTGHSNSSKTIINQAKRQKSRIQINRF